MYFDKKCIVMNKKSENKRISRMATNFNSRIIIIGAGIAGLACAKRLQQHGFKNVTILEARSRIGGRIFTHFLDGKGMEVGAQYFHGQIDNPMHSLAEDLCLFQTHKWRSSYEISGNHSFNLPKKFIQSADEICELFSEIDDGVSGLYSDLKSAQSDSKYHQKSFETIFLEKFNAFLETEVDPDQILIKKALFDWHIRYMIESNSSEPISTLSAMFYGKYEEFGGMPFTEVQNGYDAILKELNSQISSSSLKLNCAITEIDWNNSIVKLQSLEDHKYEADHVIITVPLGVLKSNHSELFKPRLPLEKISAIERLGFGTVNKIFLKFDPPFWASDGPQIDNSLLEINYNILWTDGLNYQGRCHSDGYSKKIDPDELDQVWFRYIVRFCTVLGFRDVLCGWIVGEGARHSENLPDDVIIEKCHDVLKRVVQNPKVPVPVPKLIQRSKWHNDPFSKGSYSFLSQLCDSDNITHNILAKPVYGEKDSKLPKLLFAGEATHDNMFSTTHGALLSGLREADRIHELYKGLLQE